VADLTLIVKAVGQGVIAFGISFIAFAAAWLSNQHEAIVVNGTLVFVVFLIAALNIILSYPFLVIWSLSDFMFID